MNTDFFINRKERKVHKENKVNKGMQGFVALLLCVRNHFTHSYLFSRPLRLSNKATKIASHFFASSRLCVRQIFAHSILFSRPLRLRCKDAKVFINRKEHKGILSFVALLLCVRQYYLTAEMTRRLVDKTTSRERMPTAAPLPRLIIPVLSSCRLVVLSLIPFPSGSLFNFAK